ncbi:uncharacterized protein N7518_010109 [Penicillium psychrosexuale]|uniref:uncharacterized protein n=1 Tax=Penicillium psychrosexuale TaxID=1002107 RepID=UPI002545574A|nr:uncharacterized protein N7518_010109 [Penicillium psychrosexuale]KAJ5781626.1 hypothetical protein N7518_010109 [Penicillium psychrosexuale]
MTRTIYLAIFSNGARPAHQAIFVPTGDAGMIGKIIHVTRNPAIGSFLQFKRNYNLDTTQRKPHLISIAGLSITDAVGNTKSHVTPSELSTEFIDEPSCLLV